MGSFDSTRGKERKHFGWRMNSQMMYHAIKNSKGRKKRRKYSGGKRRKGEKKEPYPDVLKIF